MVDVLLAHSYYLKYDPKQWKKMRPYPPLGTLYAASVLRRAGYTVALFDAMLSEGEQEFAELLQRHRPRYVVLYEDSFNFLVKMCLTRMREAAQRMSALARDAGALVIAAGPDVTDHPSLYFPYGVRYALLGEAEHTLCELMDCLTGRSQLTADSVAGLALSDPDAPNGVRRTPRRPTERHPDVFPLPAWDLVDVERYRAAWKQAHGYFSVNMVSTRGCPYLCNWCAKPIWGQQYAMRAPAAVADEMAQVRRMLQPDHIWFADDIFGLRPQWVAAFGQEVAARNAALPFMIQSRVDRMTPEAVEGLRKAGCVEVWLGAESGSQKILDAMEKGLRVEEIGVTRARLRDAGIRACFFIQLGYPGELFVDLLATAQMLRETLPDNIGVSVSYPLPGTRFHFRVKEQLGLKTNWIDSDELDMMFQGTYTSPFYRRLHSLLHEELLVRRRIADALATAEDLAALARTEAAWQQLACLEAQYRSDAPTLLQAAPAHPAPEPNLDWS